MAVEPAPWLQFYCDLRERVAMRKFERWRALWCEVTEAVRRADAVQRLERALERLK
jgi:hypothetical protein